MPCRARELDNLGFVSVHLLQQLPDIMEAGEQGVNAPGKVNDLIAGPKLGSDQPAFKPKLSGFLNEINGLVHDTRPSKQPIRQRIRDARRAALIQINFKHLTNVKSPAFRPVSRATEPPSNAPDGGSPILLLGG